MSMIQKLYHDYIQTREYSELVGLSGIPLTKTVSAIECGQCEDVEESIMHIYAEAEEQGFVYGFQYAMRLMMSCAPEKVKETAA